MIAPIREIAAIDLESWSREYRGVNMGAGIAPWTGHPGDQARSGRVDGIQGGRAHRRQVDRRTWTMKRREFVKVMGALSVAGMGLEARGAIGDANACPGAPLAERAWK